MSSARDIIVCQFLAIVRLVVEAEYPALIVTKLFADGVLGNVIVKTQPDVSAKIFSVLTAV